MSRTRRDDWRTLGGIDINGHFGPTEAGEPPYTRGIHKEMYRSQLWTMRQYAGFSSAE
ncbi:MAG: methylmalonyl-CoA mutase family protein, partial [Candidatus Poseidoniales archaeon]